MNRFCKQLLINLSNSSKLFSQTKSSTPITHFSSIKPLSTISTNPKTKTPKTNRKDSSVLEQFKLRQLKGSKKSSPNTKREETVAGSSGGDRTRTDPGLRDDAKGAANNGIPRFQDLGLREEVILAAHEMNIWAPTEIQCVTIPVVLDGKSVLMSSGSGSGRTLAYLLPLLQLLRQWMNIKMRPNHPRAIVLCNSEELCDEVSRVAEFICDHTQLTCLIKKREDPSKVPQDLSNADIGLLVGTPSAILEHIEHGDLFCDDIKYLVLDEADAMLSRGFSPKMQTILNLMKDNTEYQTILVTSSLIEMLGEQLEERIGRNRASQVTAMLLEMDRAEAINHLESLEILKKKVVEAIDYL